MKLLLISVFGPYGVVHEYGEKENKVDLFHNQVTREQDIFSCRFNHDDFVKSWFMPQASTYVQRRR
jgi:hypothetical protein